MTSLATVLYNFWSGFGLGAYTEGCVPDEATLPYITYTLTEPSWEDTASMQARVWYQSTSLVDINKKIDEISKKVGGGMLLTADDGSVYIYKGAPFAQFQPYDDERIKVAYLNFGTNSFIK